MSYPGKYRNLIDEETWAFIKKTQLWYPADAINYPIEKQRQVYDNLCQAFSVGYPDGVETEDFLVSTPARQIPCRRYRCLEANACAQILYFHGGGFVVGGLHSHDDYCAEICRATGFNLTAVDYRLAPEHTFPADYEDALASFRYVTRLDELPVVMLGDSAGGNLAAAVTHASRKEGLMHAGQVLIYPMLGHDWTAGSFVDHARAPMLTTEDIIYYAKMRLCGDLSVCERRECSPLNDPDLENIPPTIVFGAQCDPLRDDGANYCAAINESGGRAQFVEEKGMVHSYLLARHTVGRAQQAFNRIVQALSMLGNQRWEEGLFANRD